MPDDRIILGYVARVRHGGYRRVELDALDAGGFQGIHIVQHDGQVFIADPGAIGGRQVAAENDGLGRCAQRADKVVDRRIDRTDVLLLGLVLGGQRRGGHDQNELMYCCSVWFWEASGAAAMTRTNGREDTFGNLRGFEYDIIDTVIPEGVQDWQADISQQ